MRGPQKRSLRLAIVARLLQNIRKSGASRVLDHLLLALALPPVVLVLMYASSSSCSMCARALHPRRQPLVGVHGPPYILLPLPQAQLSAVTASRTQDEVAAGEVVRFLVDERVEVEPKFELPLWTVIGRSAPIYVSCSVSVTTRQYRLGWLPYRSV